MRIKERIEKLKNAIYNSDDNYKNEDLSNVENFIKDCGRYAEAKTAHQAAVQIARFRMEAEDYKEYMSTLDRNRRAAHDAVVTSVRLVDRLARLYGCNPVYGGADDRYEISDFALQVVEEYYNLDKKYNLE